MLHGLPGNAERTSETEACSRVIPDPILVATLHVGSERLLARFDALSGVSHARAPEESSDVYIYIYIYVCVCVCVFVCVYACMHVCSDVAI